jgi:hypothetical protein
MSPSYAQIVPAHGHEVLPVSATAFLCAELIAGRGG